MEVCVWVCGCVGGVGGLGSGKENTHDKSTKGISFQLPCSRWSLCIIHWLQAFWVGSTLLFSRGGISPQITQVKSTRSTQCQQVTSNKILKFPLIAHADICIYFKESLIFLTNWNYMIMFTCTCSLLFYIKEQYYNTMKNKEGWEINKLKNYMYNKEGKVELYFDLEWLSPLQNFCFLPFEFLYLKSHAQHY